MTRFQNVGLGSIRPAIKPLTTREWVMQHLPEYAYAESKRMKGIMKVDDHLEIHWSMFERLPEKGTIIDGYTVIGYRQWWYGNNVYNHGPMQTSVVLE